MNNPVSRPARLLLANYHADTNSIMSRLLKRHGGLIETVQTIQCALERMAAAPFDVFVCRVGMPDGCGAEAILKAWNNFAIPGIALYGTSQSQQAVAKISRQAMRGEIRMPADLNQVLESIREAIGQANFDPRAEAGRLMIDERQCPDCKGAGSIVLLVSRKPCTLCRGQGSVLPTMLKPARPVANAPIHAGIS